MMRKSWSMSSDSARLPARQPKGDIFRARNNKSPADPQTAAFEERFHLLARRPVEVARNSMLDGAGGNAVVEALLQVAVEEAVDQSRSEGIAGAETIDDLHLIRPRAIGLAVLVGDGGPRVLPHQRVLAQGNRHDLERELLRGLDGHVFVVL